MKILYITYIDLNAPQTSGSSVRPNKMLHAFLESGHTVKLLSGSTEYIHRTQRKHSIKEILSWLENETPDICYIESSTYPIIFHADRKLIKRIHKLSIPIGYFYRDFYRKFPKLFPRRKGFVNFIKESFLNILQYKTDKILNYADIIYLPSIQAKRLFDYKDMRALPPAGDNKLIPHPYNKTIIYVGGISKHYGGDLLIEAFKLLNSDASEYKLMLVCRENEWSKVPEEDKHYPWLQCFHASGEALAQLYAAAAAAIITKPDNEYNNLAISVKLFEYMSYGLPVISTDNDAMSDIIRHYGLGLIASSAEELADAVKSMLNNKDLYDNFCQNTATALNNNNLWANRAEQVVEDLSALKSNKQH